MALSRSPEWGTTVKPMLGSDAMAGQWDDVLMTFRIHIIEG
jgi:hypothetical protein